MLRRLFQVTLWIFASIGFVLLAGYVAIRLGWTKVPGIIDGQRDYFEEQTQASTTSQSWVSSEEWQTLKVAIPKDEPDIDKAAEAANISPRLIVAPLVPEQLRLFTDNRELYKEALAPLALLGVQNQFSWGVMGIKQDTAEEIEGNLKNASSTFYLGPRYAHLLDFTTTDPDTERFNRLTDSESRYYSYLYAALYEKELMEQWKNAGIDISNQPNIIATLFNIGFTHSIPHQDPQTGGAEITVNGSTYSFGGLAAAFYYSSELPEILK